MIDILLLTHNRSGWLHQCVLSLFGQSVGKHIYVLDNGSTDETTWTLLEELSNHPNGELSAHRRNENKMDGFRYIYDRIEEHSEYTCLFCDDDIMLPDSLAPRLQAMNDNQGLGMVHTQAYTMGEDGTRTGTMGQQQDVHSQTKLSGALDFHRLITLNYVISPTVMFRTSVLENYKDLMTTDRFLCNDWMMYLSMAHDGVDAAYLTTPTVQLRIHGNQIARQKSISGEYINSHFDIWKHWHQRGYEPNDDEYAALQRQVGTLSSMGGLNLNEQLDRLRKEFRGGHA